jgi:hypothetical protein
VKRAPLVGVERDDAGEPGSCADWNREYCDIAQLLPHRLRKVRPVGLMNVAEVARNHGAAHCGVKARTLTNEFLETVDGSRNVVGRAHVVRISDRYPTVATTPAHLRPGGGTHGAAKAVAGSRRARPACSKTEPAGCSTPPGSIRSSCPRPQPLMAMTVYRSTLRVQRSPSFGTRLYGESLLTR